MVMKTANSDGLLSTSAHFLLARLLHSRIFRLPALCPELEPPRFRNHPVCRPVQAERRTRFTERWPAEVLLVGEVGTVEASAHSGDVFTCCSMALRHLLAGMIQIIQVQSCNIRLAAVHSSACLAKQARCVQAAEQQRVRRIIHRRVLRQRL